MQTRDGIPPGQLCDISILDLVVSWADEQTPWAKFAQGDVLLSPYYSEEMVNCRFRATIVLCLSLYMCAALFCLFVCLFVQVGNHRQLMNGYVNGPHSIFSVFSALNPCPTSPHPLFLEQWLQNKTNALRYVDILQNIWGNDSHLPSLLVQYYISHLKISVFFLLSIIEHGSRVHPSV